MKTELLEIVFEKGCRILRLHNSTIIGSLSSNLRPQLRILNFSQPATDEENWKNSKVLEELLYSCCSLQSLEMEGVLLTPKMVEGIWYKNRKTLQRLNLNFSDIHYLIQNPNRQYLKKIIKLCQELKEVDLAYVDDYKHGTAGGLPDDNLEFLVKNIPPNVEKFNVMGNRFTDDHVKILLGRCKKIKVLSLEATRITDDSLENIGRHLFNTLEELSLGRTLQYPNITISLTGFLGLKSMPRLKILNVYSQKDGEEIQHLRCHLPHRKLSGLWRKWLE